MDYSRHGSDQEGLAAERLDGKAELSQLLIVRPELCFLAGADLQWHRLQQPLDFYLPLRSLAFNPLEKDALVGGVLVDKIEPVGALGDDIAVVELAQHPQHRQRGGGGGGRKG